MYGQRRKSFEEKRIHTQNTLHFKAEEIEATFEEEKTMGMVLGPMTQQEAAAICGCQPDQLCPGPMAGIQESDKVRTIFDGSWGGANTHIQSNTVERTTAPTVMDCVQASDFTGSMPPRPHPRLQPKAEKGEGHQLGVLQDPTRHGPYSKLTSLRPIEESKFCPLTGAFK